MPNPTKVNGWLGPRAKIFERESEARMALAREEWEELLRTYTTRSSSSWDTLDTWLKQNWSALIALEHEMTTGYEYKEDGDEE